jgi:hypothetical protein
MNEHDELIFLRKEVAKLRQKLAIIEWMTSGHYKGLTPPELVQASLAHQAMISVLANESDTYASEDEAYH